MTGEGARTAYLRAAAFAAGIDRPDQAAFAMLANVRTLSDDDLRERIASIHVLLAAANDERQRRDRAGSRDQAANRAAWMAAHPDTYPFG